MKTKALIILALLWMNYGFSQTPAINQSKILSQSSSINTSLEAESIKPIEKNITPLINDVDILKESVVTIVPPISQIAIETLKTDNKELYDKIKKQNDDIDAQNIKIESQKKEIDLQKIKIVEHNSKIIDQNKNIDTLNSQINEQEKAIKEQNGAINTQNLAIKEQAREVEKLKEVTEKEDIYQAESFIIKYDFVIKEKIKEIKKKNYEQRNKNTLEEMKAMEPEIRKLETELNILFEAKDSKVRELSYKWWMPSMNKDKRNYFFQTMYNSKDSKTKFLNSFGVSGSEYGISGQSELITDNISFFRIAFGTVLTASNNEEDVAPENETANQALDRLVNGGGNFYIETVLPLFTTINNNNSDLLTLYNYFLVRAATDIKGYGNDLDTSTGHGSAGMNLYLGFSSENRKFNFFFQGNANYTLGSKDFYKNLLIDHNNGFFNGKLIAGLTLENKFRFTANFFTFGSEPSLRREKIALGFQFLP